MTVPLRSSFERETLKRAPGKLSDPPPGDRLQKPGCSLRVHFLMLGLEQGHRDLL